MSLSSRSPFKLTKFNVRTVISIEQHAHLAHTPGTIEIRARYIQETHIQGSSSSTQMASSLPEV